MRFYDEEGRETFIIEPSKGTLGYDILFDNTYHTSVLTLSEAFRYYEETKRITSVTIPTVLIVT